LLPIITLTTDFGLRDHYAAILKGTILSRCNDVHFVDISHEIDQYNIVHGAFVLRNTYKHFPAGSIHLLAVNNYYRRTPRFLYFEHEGQYFVGPDNGIFSLVFDQMPKDIKTLALPTGLTFPLGELFAQASKILIDNQGQSLPGDAAGAITERITLQPVKNTNQIRGAVIHVDTYENVVLNIDRQLFDEVRQDRDFALYFKRHDPIITLSTHYSDVPIGELLCLFNSAGFLEIAVNMGRASSLFGLNVDDTVQIDFK
jgi:S-adenosylmethionine hydrolase